MTTNNWILVTGGAGYIGSHTCKQLALAGFKPIVYDNLRNGHRHNVKWGPLIVGDILDTEKLSRVLVEYRPAAVIHFAALAYVGESVIDPATYYHNNVAGSLALIGNMLRHDVRNIVFSSTCATYGIPKNVPISEDSPQSPINPYGASKLMVERIIDDYSAAYGLKFAILRYFNASGADLDGELAEEHEPETHLIPRCMQAAAGLIDAVEILGVDYPTPDGTCIRDYIHVTDLADGHVKALSHILKFGNSLKLNLGTGQGVSVRQILDGIRHLHGRAVPHISGPRRAGDPPVLIANGAKAREIIGFSPNFSSIETILQSAWARYAHML